MNEKKVKLPPTGEQSQVYSGTDYCKTTITAKFQYSKLQNSKIILKPVNDTEG